MSPRLACAVLGVLAAAGVRPVTPDLAEQQREGRQVVRQILLDQTPAENSLLHGMLRIRAPKGKWKEMPITCRVIRTATNWQSVYEAQTGATNLVRLTVTHADAQPNRYTLDQSAAADCCDGSPTNLTSRQLMLPFAGSDFWVADLGLEFLHWPDQRLRSREVHRSQSCFRLESFNPDPAPGAYARVESWLTIEPPHGIVEAEAYDAAGKLMKKFEPKDLEKVNGQYQVKTLDIRNVKTESRARMEFDFDTK